MGFSEVPSAIEFPSGKPIQQGRLEARNKKIAHSSPTQHMTPALRFRVHYERNVSLSMEMSFFAICPFNQRHCTVPKNGMNFNQPMPIVCGLDSSGFSGQWSKHHKGIAKKDISMLSCI